MIAVGLKMFSNALLGLTLLTPMVTSFPSPQSSFSEWQKVDASHISHRPLCSLPEFWICDWIEMWVGNNATQGKPIPKIESG